MRNKNDPNMDGILYPTNLITFKLGPSQVLHLIDQNLKPGKIVICIKWILDKLGPSQVLHLLDQILKPGKIVMRDSTQKK